MFEVSDYEFMAQALRLAQRGLYTCDPNPRVGCVLVKDGQVIGRGWHERAGEAHAEVNAITNAGESAQGSTAYVTLEPCCHHGKTPPCTSALIDAGVSEVIIASVDPNPDIAGRGIDALNAAGIQTRLGLLGQEAEALNPGHYMRMQHNRPFIRLKLAASLDARTALASGESKWITGKDARDDVQRLRARSSAVMTGIGTVLADDPALNVRIESLLDEYRGDIRQPLRIILDSQLRISDEARLLHLPGDILLVTTVSEQDRIDAKLEILHKVTKNLEIITVPGDANDRCDLDVLMSVLATGGINELHVECGPTLAGHLLTSQLIDEFVLYLAPHILGNSAQGLFTLSGIDSMDERMGLLIQEVRKIGSDYRVVSKPNPNHFPAQAK